MPRNYVHPRYQVDHIRDAQIADLYKAGHSTYEIGEMFGTSPGPVTAALKRLGVPRRKSGRAQIWFNSPEQRQQAIALYATGNTLHRVGQILHCRTDVVIAILREEGIARRPPGVAIKLLSDDESAAIAQEYEAGSSMGAIGARFGVSRDTVRNHLVRHGVAIRRGHVRPGGDGWRDEVARRYTAGERQDALAAEFGVHQSTVSNLLRGRGLLPVKPKARGENHGSWKGGRYVNVGGYVCVIPPESARHLIKTSGSPYVLEHRLVLAQALGRPLKRTESVHHINGDKTDNRLENLQLRHGSHGSGVVFRCADCGSHNLEAAPLA